MEEERPCVTCRHTKPASDFRKVGNYRLKRCRECYDVVCRNREMEGTGRRDCVICLRPKKPDDFRVVNGKNRMHQCKACEQRKRTLYLKTPGGSAMIRAARERENAARRKKLGPSP